MAQRGRRIRPEVREQTRLSMLDAGLELLRQEQSAPALLVHVKAAEVARRANLTHGALYYYWPTQEAYRADLARHALRPAVHQPAQPAWQRLQYALAVPDHDHAQAVRVAGELAYTHALDDQLFRTRLHALSVLEQEETGAEVREAVSSYYRQSETAVLDTFTGILRQWGLRVREDWDEQAVLTLFTALLEGLAMRGLAEPEALTRGGQSLVGESFWLLLDACTVSASASERDQEQSAPAKRSVPAKRNSRAK